MHNIKEEIIRELHEIDKSIADKGGFTPSQLDLTYRLACTYHYICKISDKKENSAEHTLERAEHYFKKGDFDLAKAYLDKAKDMWMNESDRDWYADLEVKLTKGGYL